MLFWLSKQVEFFLLNFNSTISHSSLSCARLSLLKSKEHVIQIFIFQLNNRQIACWDFAIELTIAVTDTISLAYTQGTQQGCHKYTEVCLHSFTQQKRKYSIPRLLTPFLQYKMSYHLHSCWFQIIQHIFCKVQDFKVEEQLGDTARSRNNQFCVLHETERVSLSENLTCCLLCLHTALALHSAGSRSANVQQGRFTAVHSMLENMQHTVGLGDKPKSYRYQNLRITDVILAMSVYSVSWA